MDVAAVLRVAERSRLEAESCLAAGDLGRGFSHLLLAVKLHPEWQQELREVFATALCGWGRVLERRGRLEDLFRCYEQAVEVFPTNSLVLNNLGAHLLRCGQLTAGRSCLERSLTLDGSHLQTLRNLENASSMQVERWHFRMLNDEHRNEAFREAVVKMVRGGRDTVLDIGTGTGLLSLFAVSGGATTVTACDVSETMVAVAGQVLRANAPAAPAAPAAPVALHHCHSSQLRLPARVSLAVCEVLDCGLLGEHVLQTVAHAWDKLLEPGGAVVPRAATLYVAGVQCDAVSRRFHPPLHHPLLSGLDVASESDAYDTEDLRRTPHVVLTDVREVARVDFNSKEAVADALAGGLDNPCVLSCAKPGRLDCLVAWFDLRLDEEIVLSTGPESPRDRCWDQAVFPLPRAQDLEAGQQVPCRASLLGGKLSISVLAPPAPSLHLSEPATLLLNAPSVLRHLRDTQTFIETRFPRVAAVLDTWPFPVCGLSFAVARSARVVSVVAADCDRRVVEAVATRLGVRDRVTCVVEEDFEPEGEFDVVLVSPADTTGELKERLLAMLPTLRTCLGGDGALFPGDVTVVGQLVDSDWLDRVSKVSHDQATCGYVIAPFINVYAIQNHIDFDLTTLERVERSEPFDLLTVRMREADSDAQTVSRTVAVTSPGRVNAVVYWLTFGEVVTRSSAHVRQAAVLFKPFDASERVNIRLIYKSGLFKIDVLDC